MMNLSIIEGFYGCSWSFSERQRLIKNMKSSGFSRYCYAPKSDRYLRKNWQQSWPSETFTALKHLSEQAKEHSVAFELGLSPFNLVDHWNESSRVALKTKIDEINILAPVGLNILFDDMSSCHAALGEVQAEISDFISQHSHAENFIVCPSYYSFDPILEEVFGPMPLNYLDDLGCKLDAAFDVFWTGDKVISDSYQESSIARAEHLLQRKPIIWDNSLANDGKKTSPYLKFSPMKIRQSEIPSNVAGIYFNPMNQLAVAECVLSSFSAQGFVDFEQLLATSTESLSRLLVTYKDLFANQSVRELSSARKSKIIGELQPFLEQPLAKNIADWLAGMYKFDPGCLT